MSWISSLLVNAAEFTKQTNRIPLFAIISVGILRKRDPIEVVFACAAYQEEFSVRFGTALEAEELIKTLFEAAAKRFNPIHTLGEGVPSYAMIESMEETSKLGEFAAEFKRCSDWANAFFDQG